MQCRQHLHGWRLEGLSSGCLIKVELKVTSVHGRIHLVKHLPCQHQDLDLIPKIQVKKYTRCPSVSSVLRGWGWRSTAYVWTQTHVFTLNKQTGQAKVEFSGGVCAYHV